VQLIKVT